MSLGDVLELVRQVEKELVLFNVDPTDPIAGRLSSRFETQNVRVTTARTASGGPTDVAVLSNDSGVLEVVDVDTLREFVDHSPSQSGTGGISDAKYGHLLSHLKETTFASHDTETMLYTSREIEDRARRVGAGTIHAGFQRCSVIADQRAIYTDLAGRGLDVHAYGVPDTTPPDLGGVRTHTPGTDEIAGTWFVVFDGGGTDRQKTGLVAEEVDGGTFRGAWTYDPEIVDRVLEYLETTYLPDGTRTRSEI